MAMILSTALYQRPRFQAPLPHIRQPLPRFMIRFKMRPNDLVCVVVVADRERKASRKRSLDMKPEAVEHAPQLARVVSGAACRVRVMGPENVAADAAQRPASKFRLAVLDDASLDEDNRVVAEGVALEEVGHILSMSRPCLSRRRNGAQSYML